MTRTWKIFGLLPVLALVLAAWPAPAAAAEDDLRDIARRLKVIEDAMTEIQKSADAIVKEGLRYNSLAARLKRLEETVGRMQTQLEALSRGAPPRNGERVSAYPPDGLDDIRARLDRIERGLETRTRVSRAAPEFARILLTNRYPEDMTFTVNGTSYVLAPGTSRLLDRAPAGTLTYEVSNPVWGVRARKTTVLLPDETFRVTVD